LDGKVNTCTAQRKQKGAEFEFPARAFLLLHVNMARILHIETATDICSIAVSDGLQLLSIQTADGVRQHAAQITLLIQSVLGQARLSLSELDAVSVSSGPGSYTSLRVGTSTAKGICYTLDKPLIAVDTLQSLALASLNKEREEGLYLPMIDARRMEVYTARFDATNERLTEAAPLIVAAETFQEELDKGIPLILSGNGAEKCKKVLPASGIVFSPVVCSAAHLIPLALKRYEAEQFEDVAYYSPFYLKAPNVTKSKKKLL
jgi:tRNA threonylcarbamoyladenosine biosynthesis protein TsaB